MQLEVHKSKKEPVYQQIVQWVTYRISEGELVPGDRLPSINQIAGEQSLARETIVRAFRILQGKGLIEAVHGKGFFVANSKKERSHRIFLLLDALSAYKEVLYAAIKDKFGEQASIDICFHHYNPRTFEMLVQEAKGKYTDYIVLPFDTPTITDLLDPIIGDNLFLVDRWPSYFKKNYYGVYQDFYSDIQRGLNQCAHNIGKYKRLNLVFRDGITDLPLELVEGFEEFCYQQKLPNAVVFEDLKLSQIRHGEGYITMDDTNLVALIEAAGRKDWRIGHDLGLISYNDTPLKKVAAGGITVISTDFARMGREIASQVLENKRACKANAATLIDRGSF